MLLSKKMWLLLIWWFDGLVIWWWVFLSKKIWLHISGKGQGESDKRCPERCRRAPSWATPKGLKLGNSHRMKFRFSFCFILQLLKLLVCHTQNNLWNSEKQESSIEVWHFVLITKFYFDSNSIYHLSFIIYHFDEFSFRAETKNPLTLRSKKRMS